MTDSTGGTKKYVMAAWRLEQRVCVHYTVSVILGISLCFPEPSEWLG